MYETGYYRILVDHEEEVYSSRGFMAGKFTYIERDGDKVTAHLPECTFTYDLNKPVDIEEFAESFEFLPDGPTIIAQAIAQKTIEIGELKTSMVIDPQLLLQAGFTNSPEATESAAPGTGLSVRASNMVAVKKAVADVRNKIALCQKDIEAKTKEVEQLIEFQQSIMAIKVAEMEKQLERVTEALWTINLYLGKNEDIIILNTGKPADVEEKITIRQRVLFMDEECGDAADGQGITFKSITQFDEWLLEDPEHVQQVIPEEKCIIAMHVKRHDFQKYEDPRVAMASRDANLKWTYFLIRNGENLYRIFVDIVAGESLFPKADEYAAYFSFRDRHTGEVEYLKPGTDDYMKAEEKADKLQRHYMRLALILQGIMDRTPIFKPMPVDRINIGDPRSAEEFIWFVHDHELLITDGKPEFFEWLKGVNDKIEVGCRILGNFRGAGLHGDQHSESQIYPRSAGLPDDNVLHTITKADSKAITFTYDRPGDYVKGRWKKVGRYGKTWVSGHDTTAKASCWLYRGDSFYIHYDGASIEDVRYYLNDRRHRKEYRTMIPLMETILAQKEIEVASEKDFRMLLTGQIMSEHGVSEDTAKESLDTLIHWWKFKTRVHRALTSDDKKAINMIVTEFGLRRKQDQVRSRAGVDNDDAHFVSMMETMGRQAVMIAHKKDNQYVVYIPCNKQNVWVHEETWTFNRISKIPTLKDRKEWVVVDKRHERWAVIYADARWAEWTINPVSTQCLTDHEISYVVDTFLKMKMTHDEKEVAQAVAYAERTEQEPEHINTYFRPYIVTCSDKYEIVVWYSESAFDASNIGRSYPREPNIYSVKIKWKKTQKELTVTSTWGWSGNTRCGSEIYSIQKWKGIRRWDDNINAMVDEMKTVRKLQKEWNERQNRYRHVRPYLQQCLLKIAEQNLYQSFKDDHGLDELWPDYLKTRRSELKIPSTVVIDYMITFVSDTHDEPIIGKTLAEVADRAMELGFGGQDFGEWYEKKKYTKANIDPGIPMDFIIPPKDQKTIEEEELEDDEEELEEGADDSEEEDSEEIEGDDPEKEEEVLEEEEEED